MKSCLRVLAIGLFVGLLLAVAACSAPSATAPPGGMVEARAIDAARQLLDPHDGSLEVASATAGPFRLLGGGVVLHGVSPDRWVWAIAFTGSFRGPCPTILAIQPPDSCGTALGHETVVIDYQSGTLLVAETSP